ncbi:hypothetical protein [Staphylococcus edaphicus]|uniref:Lipoprotein n=1 Tax=Staphylococcus edaphicus TaxID=1955013 RepID=A0A2C6VKN9_9STAP|nr:hypothetical protein [Staphylococcus edaphicus]PHK50751.1 hypothetical protein BTJ66_00145 [Staphylococcus edaphicus]UQW82440.1 hypothetical protein MNY58_05090 [Staphylococcus edaphicus]
MKKVLFLLLASFLVMAACGNKEESKSEDKKETKTSNKDSKKKDDKKSKDEKVKKTKEETKQVTKDENTQEQPSTQENVQSQEQQATADSQQPVQQEEVPATSKAYGLDYNYPQENKANNPTGELIDQDAQRMADQASEYDAEVAEHNTNVDANQ